MKATENRLRRKALRRGLLLRKSRVRNPQVVEYGTYMLVDAATNLAVAGGYEALNLEQVEDELRED